MLVHQVSLALDRQHQVGACMRHAGHQHAVALPQYDGIVHGSLVRRYKRFLADVHIHTPEAPVLGEPIVVHCPNTGAMTGLLDR